MTKFKVFGDKLISYILDVDANSAEEAWDIASNAATHQWTEIETDSVIEVHGVEKEIDLVDDEYPSMENEIVVTDKSDKTE